VLSSCQDSRIRKPATLTIVTTAATATAAPPATATPARPALRYHTLLCRDEKQTPQMGILGESVDDRERIVAMDLTYMNCISLFGEPGAGKSYCMGTIIEMCCARAPGINVLPNPIATVVFHYSPTQIYKPEFASSILPNDIAAQVATLKQKYGADPGRVEDCILLAPKDMVAARREEFPGIACFPLAFSSAELQAGHWKILMGAVGEDDSMYFQVMNQILRRHRGDTTVAKVRADIDTSYLCEADKDKARIRLSLAAEYIDDDVRVKDYIKPGRLVLVDLRDEYIQKKEALSLLIVLLQLFADTTDNGKPLQKFVVFDEAHKYMRDPSLVDSLTETIREMRHKSTSIMIASQDPPSVPLPIIELSSMTVMLKMSSPLWLKHVAMVKPAYNEIGPAQMAALSAGEAYVWVKTASDTAYTLKPQKLRIRPRFTKHGGDTKTAVKLKDTVGEQKETLDPRP
jgi:hypothetical protein